MPSNGVVQLNGQSIPTVGIAANPLLMRSVAIEMSGTSGENEDIPLRQKLPFV